eukprot:213098-Chlamydomonas_euryale.AAC.3
MHTQQSSGLDDSSTADAQTQTQKTVSAVGAPRRPLGTNGVLLAQSSKAATAGRTLARQRDSAPVTATLENKHGHAHGFPDLGSALLA